MQAPAGPVVAGMAGRNWLDHALDWRDRLLASDRFRRWAATFPLTRPIARRRARALFDLCAGFVYAQVLLACVRLRLFEILAEGPQAAADLERRLSLSPDATARLLNAAVSLRLVARRGHSRFALGPLGAAMVGNRAVAAMIEHHPRFYLDLRDPVALLRGENEATELGRYWAYARADRPSTLTPDQVAGYTALMAASQPLIAAEVLDVYPVGRHRCLLDVGGGDGTFLAAAAARAPDLRLILFDLPSVAERAAARLEAVGLGQRACTVGGDFHVDALPEGADLISLIRVVHDHDDAAALAILRAARRALPAQGVLLLAEPMAGTPGAEPIGDAYFAFYLLALGSGRPRTPSELRELLRRAGFGDVRQVPTHTPLLVSVMLARPNQL